MNQHPALEAAKTIMELDDQQVTIALREAFSCYLSLLGRAKNLREARLPGQGKAIETASDLSIEHSYQQRVAAAEICLRYTSDIAVSLSYLSLS
jgi:hypothetical protein